MFRQLNINSNGLANTMEWRHDHAELGSILVSPIRLSTEIWESTTVFLENESLYFSRHKCFFQDPRVKVAQKPCSLCQCSKRSFPQWRRLWSRRLISESSMSVVWRSQSLYNLLGRHFQPKGQIALAMEANLAMLFSIFFPKICHLLILIEDDYQ